MMFSDLEPSPFLSADLWQDPREMLPPNSLPWTEWVRQANPELYRLLFQRRRGAHTNGHRSATVKPWRARLPAPAELPPSEFVTTRVRY